MVDGAVEASRGAHFTSCVPDHERDEAFQAEYARAAADPATWEGFWASWRLPRVLVDDA
jgi:glutaconate CoA-transferase subunit A